MANYNRSLNFERHVSEFFNDWKAVPILEGYVRQRMQQRGLRPGQIGIIDDVETGAAFSLEHFVGGRNSRPAWNPAVTKGGINVDPGLFNPELLAAEAPSWATASLIAPATWEVTNEAHIVSWPFRCERSIPQAKCHEAHRP